VSGRETPLYVMVSGFLGSGKTTALARLAKHLVEQGERVGLITNDQSSGLVDSRLLASQGHPVEEIAGGCFCCRFHSLDEAVGKLTADTRPDVFVAEPVGSCTDLVATVGYPLRRIYGERVALAPLTVLVDPLRAARVLGLEEGRAFSEKVRYVYEKQLEEADLILINKLDRIDEAQHGRLAAELERRFPRAEVLAVSMRDGTGVDAWYERVLRPARSLGPVLEIDYERYAEGEALLGWLNATVRVAADEPFDANGLLRDLTGSVRARLEERGAEIAHLKMTLDAQLEGGQLAALSVVGGEWEADERESLLDAVDGGELTINLRAEGDPDDLTDAVARALAGHAGPRFTVEHQEAFRPAAPVPVFREGQIPEEAAS